MNNIKYMLYEYPEINGNIQELNKELNLLNGLKEDTQDTLKAQVIDDMPHGTEVGNPTLSAVCKTIDCYGKRITEICNRINELLDMKTTVERALQVLEVDERRLIDLRYFNKQKMKQVQFEMKYSKMGVYIIHDRAINKLSDKIECKTA